MRYIPLQIQVPVDMTELKNVSSNISSNLLIMIEMMERKGVDEPMHYPRTFVIGLEADSHIISSTA